MSVFPADTAQVITHPRQMSQAHYLPLTAAGYSLIHGRNENVRVLPAWQPAAHLFPDGQGPNPGACGQCPLREDGRK